MAGNPSKMQIVWISGLSGSGKTTAIKTLEDIGYFCIDNLPIVLLPTFVDLIQNSKLDINRIGIVVDIREKEFLKDAKKVLTHLRETDYKVSVYFLETSDDVLITRFKTTRRYHPLAPSGNIQEGIRKERQNLSFMKKIADQTIDTSNLSIHELRKRLIRTFTERTTEQKMTVTFLSFGFKHGLPPELDLLFDVRFLPNPFFEDALRDLTGRDKSVKEFVLDNRDEASQFLSHVEGLLLFLIPKYVREGKVYLTIGIGCTGGVHRSVAIAEELKDRFGVHLKEKQVRVMVEYRDIGKE